MTHILTDISSIVFMFVGLLLIFVILLQRGRGGGLAGAFGGAGGQSAFGTKAGDVFTRITIGIALVWVIMAILTGYAMTYESGKVRFVSKVTESKDAAAEGEAVPANPGKTDPFENGSESPTPPASKESPKTTTSPPQKSAAAAKDKNAPAPTKQGTGTPPATPSTPTK
jgi:preprotein translocase subunit SecG